MGNSTLIIVLFAVVLIGSVIFGLNSKTSMSVEETTEKFKEVQSRLIANSSLEMYLNKLRRNKSLRGNFTANNLLSGKYDISVTGGDTVRILSYASFLGKNSISRADLIWENITLPTVKSGLSISTTNLDLKLNGNILISGNDTNPDGSPGSGGSILGISVNNSSDSIRVTDSLNNNVKSKITGTGGAPSIGVSTDSINYSALASQFVQAADIILPGGTYSSGTTMGSMAEPKITHVTGNVNFGGNSTGAGVLVVYGNMSWSGNFAYNGLVLIYGNSSITASASGTSKIYGAVLVAGQTVNFQVTGSAEIYYSSLVLNLLKNNLKSNKFVVKNWLEDL
ncbi:MAG: hypothetical protein FJ213_10745 [Ignavibacteria bacterium]|nr:hypothetical protein [Ignavibacteria bacterium]